MEKIRSSETSVLTRTTWYDIPEDRILNTSRVSFPKWLYHVLVSKGVSTQVHTKRMRARSEHRTVDWKVSCIQQEIVKRNANAISVTHI
jgi:hypothetical protein